MDAIIERKAPARLLIAVTPDDSVDLVNGPARMLYVGGTGNLALVMPDNATPVVVTAAVGTMLYISAKRVNSTSTTATNIVAFY